MDLPNTRRYTLSIVDGTQHRLGVNLSADVFGYSRLTSVDETGTPAALRAHGVKLIDAKIAEHGGNILESDTWS